MYLVYNHPIVGAALVFLTLAFIISVFKLNELYNKRFRSAKVLSFKNLSFNGKEFKRK